MLYSSVSSDYFLIEKLQKKSPWKAPLYFFETVTSTNDIALEMASQGAVEGTIVIAEEQTQGRGKRYRPWSSPKGLGVFLSLILRLPITMDFIPSLSRLGPVALCDAIENLSLPIASLQIKEPNDLLIDGQKVAGVLVETSPGASPYAVLGIGINMYQQENDFPPEIPYPVTSLALASKKPVAREEMIISLIQALYERYEQVKDAPEELEDSWKSKLLLTSTASL
ncbi:MAG: biotin--[acetyl-CoA-carboxylase] ligase [Chthoniobacterales bacterium]|nr:biotin--[acetyl-CoA-carboxylase] ligase [Chthoniobacterales bacterium]